MPERRLKKRLAEAFDKAYPEGWYTAIRAGIGGQKIGTPDQYFAVRGRSAWIESKVLPNGLTDLQAHQINAMRLAGLRVLVLVACPKTGVLQLMNGGEGSDHPIDIWSGAAFSTAFWKAVFA